MPGAKKDHETGLTQKDETFCVLYVTGGEAGDKALIGNGKECYRKAYKAKKQKDSTLYVNASKKMALAKIQQRIKKLREQIAEKAVITETEVLNIAASLARATLADFYDDQGRIKPTSEWTDDMKHAAASLKTFEEFEGRGEDREYVGDVRELKLWDKNSALERLFKYFGMFEKDNKQKTDPIRELLDAVNGRSGLTVKS
ncbi:MAG: terminase small subunit [Acidobacteria bacterium]|nr:terminase small subunit [Acidobacteriota bacterium]